jgi:hypothetical protein
MVLPVFSLIFPGLAAVARHYCITECHGPDFPDCAWRVAVRSVLSCFSSVRLFPSWSNSGVAPLPLGVCRHFGIAASGGITFHCILLDARAVDFNLMVMMPLLPPFRGSPVLWRFDESRSTQPLPALQ